MTETTEPKCCSLTDALAKIIALMPEDKKDKLDAIVEYLIIQILELAPEASDENLLAIAKDASAVVRKTIEFCIEHPAAVSDDTVQ